jgi:hypothetical protein
MKSIVPRLVKLAALPVVALALTGTALAQEPPPPPPPGIPPALPAPPPVAPAQRCLVPNLKGLTLVAATRKLARSGCRLGKVTRVSASAGRPGRVVKQSARAGASLAAGTRVSLQVARSRI